MDLKRAFSYVFDDREWFGKLAMFVMLTFASIVLMPVLLLGLLPLCVLLGYMLEIINNVRDEKRVIMPRWDNMGDWLSRGAGVLLALMVYNLPLIIVGCCATMIPGASRDALIDGFATLSMLCCVVPLAVVYVVFTWPMLAVGMARYARGGSSNEFFQAGRLFEISSGIRTYSLQWVLCVFILHFLTIAVSILLVCVGWALVAALTIPVHAHLLGQYARRIDNYQKRKNAALRPPQNLKTELLLLLLRRRIEKNAQQQGFAAAAQRKKMRGNKGWKCQRKPENTHESSPEMICP